MRLLTLLSLSWLSLASCQADETIRAYGAGEGVWQLAEMNGKPVTVLATLQFTDRHQISGTAPCNSYSARMDVPYPWWGTGPIAATKRACPDLSAEAAFFSALEGAKLSSAKGQQLILSAEDGSPLLVFTPAD